MVKKVSVVVALFLLLCCLLCSCEEPMESTQITLDSGQTVKRIAVLYDDHPGDYIIIVDKETRVQYLVGRGMECIDIQVLVDAEGKPLLYTGDINE